MSEFPWYTIVKGKVDLEQGDIIYKCPSLDLPQKEINTGSKIQVDVKQYDVVILSQSCDLVNAKINSVLLCPFAPLSYFQTQSDILKSSKGLKSLAEGNITGYHPLNECKLKNYESEILVIDFHNVFTLPFTFIDSLAKKRETRLRLLPPYREHLSQAFARFIMRVGLPIDIDLSKYKKEK